MPNFLQLQIEAVQPYDLSGRTVSRVRGSILAQQGLGTTKVFVHEKEVVNLSTEADAFVTVASPYELSLYPEDTPNPATGYPYFRKSSFDILVPGVKEAEAVAEEIRNLVKSLCETADLLETLEVVWTGWLPSTPP